MPLSWNEIKHKALAFSKHWADAANEDSEAKPFWIAFFEIFGITDKRVATFELNVKKLGAAQGFVDLFWPGMLLVEHKSRGKDLDRAFAQALDYFPGLPERDLPQLIIVCDFARFRVHDLANGQVTEFALADLHQHVRLFGFIAGYKVQTIQAQDPVNIRAAERKVAAASAVVDGGMSKRDAMEAFGVMSLAPAALMQRIIQRLKACVAMIIPNSISESSGDFGETRWAEETMRCFFSPRTGAVDRKSVV